MEAEKDAAKLVTDVIVEESGRKPEIRRPLSAESIHKFNGYIVL